MGRVEFITRPRLDELSVLAQKTLRLRRNYNFHLTDDDACHRLLNFMEPASYIQPHRHLDIHKDEALVAIRGKMGVVIYDEAGNIEEKAILSPDGEIVMVDIPHGKFHTLLSLQAGSVFFEAKAGPYRPLIAQEKAPWAPEEGQEAAGSYLVSLRRLFEPPQR